MMSDLKTNIEKMEKYKGKYKNQSLRLQNWDYSWNSYYFITICTKDRYNFFGNIDTFDTSEQVSNQDGKMILNEIGEIAQRFLLEIPEHFKNVKLDEFVIMPNHIHVIVCIENLEQQNNNDIDNVGTRHCLVPTVNTLNKYDENIGKNRFQNQGKNTISSIIGSYKSICTKTINKTQNKIFFAWQPRFYEHIIRDEKSLENIRQYIIDNPLKWDSDENNIKGK